MGTFHTGKHELHGITVVVESTGAETYVGRCDDILDDRVILLDVDVHHEGDGPPKEEYLRKAAQWGVFKKHDRLIVDRSQVASIQRLSEL